MSYPIPEQLRERIQLYREIGKEALKIYLAQKKQTPRFKYVVIENGEYFFFHHIFNATSVCSPSNRLSVVGAIEDGLLPLFLTIFGDTPNKIASIDNIHFYTKFEDIPAKYGKGNEKASYCAHLDPRLGEPINQ